MLDSMSTCTTPGQSGEPDGKLDDYTNSDFHPLGKALQRGTLVNLSLSLRTT